MAEDDFLLPVGVRCGMGREEAGIGNDVVVQPDDDRVLGLLAAAVATRGQAAVLLFEHPLPVRQVERARHLSAAVRAPVEHEHELEPLGGIGLAGEPAQHVGEALAPVVGRDRHRQVRVRRLVNARRRSGGRCWGRDLDRRWGRRLPAAPDDPAGVEYHAVARAENSRDQVAVVRAEPLERLAPDKQVALAQVRLRREQAVVHRPLEHARGAVIEVPLGPDFDGPDVARHRHHELIGEGPSQRVEPRGIRNAILVEERDHLGVRLGDGAIAGPLGQAYARWRRGGHPAVPGGAEERPLELQLPEALAELRCEDAS